MVGRDGVRLVRVKEGGIVNEVHSGMIERVCHEETTS